MKYIKVLDVRDNKFYFVTEDLYGNYMKKGTNGRGTNRIQRNYAKRMVPKIPTKTGIEAKRRRSQEGMEEKG